uniref:Uncharacterized protein n=1 Tax=uncultured marine virus TaxID=186617 RepID=S4TE36_9VIRU|nr:hypothetical protein [uncultured marine virus]
MAKIQRAELTLLYDLSGLDAGDEGYIDLAESLSMLNRKLFEQGRLYHISSIETVLSTPNAQGVNQGDFCNIGVARAPNTWVTANAWYKALKTWQAMRAEVLDKNPSLQSKWDDFKVYLNNDHFDAGQTNNLTPAFSKEGEWNMATMTLPDWSVGDTAKEFEVGLCDDDVGSVPAGNLTYGGIIYNYQESRARVSGGQPDVPANASLSWGIRLLDMGGQESELTDQIIGENDYPPYDLDEYPGTSANEPLTLMGMVTANAYNLEQSRPGGYVPCGVLKVNLSDDSQPLMGPGLVIRMTPGTYKGVHAPTMRQ